MVRLQYFGFITIIGLFAAIAPARAQNGQTSSGTDFWMAFMPNYLNPADNIRIFVASGTTNRVHVDVQGGSSGAPSEHFTEIMTANTVWTLSLPNPQLAEERTPEKAEYRAVHVYSDNPVSVYGLSNVLTSTESYLALPTSTLGTEYYPSCFYDDSYAELGLIAPLAGEFVIVAPYDNTQVTIGPARTDTRSDATGTISHHTGDIWTVKLNKGQTYLVQSTGLNVGQEDVTGTHIVSTKPVSVISGHQRCRIPVDGHGNSKDLIMEMMPPVGAWGSEYYVMPQIGRTACGDYVRIIAGEDNVLVTENGQTIAQLTHAGDFMDRELVTDPVVYKSNGKKFFVVDHSYSQGFNGDPNPNTDPFSIVMTSREQFQKKMLFRVPNNVAAGSSYDNYVTFIGPKDSISHILLNGKRITSYQLVGRCDSFPGTNPAMGAYRIKLPNQTATYTAMSGAPFAAYIFGFSYAEAYGHPAGMRVAIISPDSFPPLVRIVDSACGTYHLRFYEPRPLDTRIAEIAMITDSNDLRWSKASYNFKLSPDPNFISGDSAIGATLSVIDPGQDGYAAIYVTDRAGNDTVYEYYSYSPKLTFTPSPPYSFATLAGKDTCVTIGIRNTDHASINIDSIHLGGFGSSGSFDVSPTASRVLQPDSTLSLRVCFNPKDTFAVSDTLQFLVGLCYPYVLPLNGEGVTSLISVADQDFGNVRVGDTACKTLTITNPGKAALTVTSQDLINDPDFSFSDILPITIAAGGNKTVTYCFHPHTSGSYSKRVTFGNLNPSPYEHSIKDTALLMGTSGNANVEQGAGLLILDRAYPNPFRSSITIRYTQKEAGQVVARIFDVTGREVRSFSSSGITPAGAHDLQLDLSMLPPGLYVCSLSIFDASGAIAAGHPIFMTKE
jgi:hypothetical protein